MKYIRLIFFLVILAAGLTACGGGSGPNGEPDPGDTPYMTVVKRDYTISSDGGTLYATVSANTTYRATPSKSWCKAEILSGSSDNLKLTVDPHTGTLNRTAGVLLEASGCSPVELTVTQDAYKDPGESGDGDKDYLEFRAASYNIRYNAQEDIDGGNGWSVRAPQIANLFHNYGFDIVGTQEASNAQLTAIEPLLGGYSNFKYGYGSNTAGTSHNCITFYKTDKFTLLNSGVYYYSLTPDTPSKGWDGDYRICSWGKFREKTTGIEFYFFNSHFYWQGTQARPPSGPLHVEKTKAIAGSSPAISTGDFNSAPSTTQIAAIMTLYSDSYHITEATRVGPEGTSFAGGVFTGTPGSRIDYVFVKGGIKIRDYKVLDDQYYNGKNVLSYPSDHLPVTAKVAIEIPKGD